MKFIKNIIRQEIAEKFAMYNDISVNRRNKILKSASKRIIDDIIPIIKNSLLRSAPAMLREHRKLENEFRKRNRRRWKPAMDHLYMMWVICEEAGAEFNNTYRPEAVKTNDYKYEALAQLHGRALLITQEIMALLDCGFPDGALTRWRSLHEITVAACFIHEHEQETAKRYLASFEFRSQKAAHEYNLYAERAMLKPFSSSDLSEIDDRCDALKAEIGEALLKYGDYDWARPALKNSGQQRPTFLDLEKATGLDHWRPRYRWACQHIHSGSRPDEKMLGLAEASEEMILVGASNSGFVDPIQMTALSLNTATSAFLTHSSSEDRLVIVMVLVDFADELSNIAIETEQKTNQ